MRILTGGEYSGQPTGEGVPVALAESGSQPKKIDRRGSKTILVPQMGGGEQHRV